MQQGIVKKNIFKNEDLIQNNLPTFLETVLK